MLRQIVNRSHLTQQAIEVRENAIAQMREFRKTVQHVWLCGAVFDKSKIAIVGEHPDGYRGTVHAICMFIAERKCHKPGYTDDLNTKFALKLSPKRFDWDKYRIEWNVAQYLNKFAEARQLMHKIDSWLYRSEREAWLGYYGGLLQDRQRELARRRKANQIHNTDMKRAQAMLAKFTPPTLSTGNPTDVE